MATVETSIPARSNVQAWAIAALALPAVVGLGVNLTLTQGVCVPYLVGGSSGTFAVALLSQLAFTVLGVLILIFRPENRIGWLCLAAGTFGGSQYAIGTVVRCALDGLITVPALPYLAWFDYHLGAGGIPWVIAVFILLPMIFPTGRFLSPAWRRVTLAGLLTLSLILAAAAFSPNFRQPNAIGVAYPLASPFGISGLPDWWHNAFVPSQTLLLIALSLAGIAAIIIRLWRSRGIERQQMKWLAYFLGSVISVQLLVFELPGMAYPQIFETIWYDLVITATLLGYPLTIGIAIFRYRLYDIDLIINRTLVYGGLTVGVVAGYAAIVGGLSLLLHDQQNVVSAILATVVIALIFQPLRERLQKGVNRLMFGERDDPYAVLATLSRQLQASALPDQILPTIAATICRTLKLPYAMISIQRTDGKRQIVATGGQPAQITAEWPLQFHGEIVGWLAVAPRSPGEPFTPNEQRLLADIAAQSGAVAASVRLTGALQAARERLVLAREEERRRIRRDLHDELGPTLASQTLRLDTAIDMLDAQPDKAAELLTTIKARNQAIVAEIRRLVHELRPPALDELGLVSALRAAVRQLGATSPQINFFRTPDPLPGLPAAASVRRSPRQSTAVTS
jgi:two-component system, NarL family, sensor kinase